MKILGISLKNLASLAGEHHIDFTAEPLANAGLFAITGPTGSGKSTVLDAVCLALYGTTPRLREAGSGIRLADISGKPLTAQDARHLLRRGCEDGYAHVAFRGLDGVHYRAVWNIRRARATRGMPGQLKIDRQLVTVDGGQVLNTTPSELDALIPEKVGLSFDQFTRAVLLAQSEFSAFLKANENDRGELLEKLTNTQLYSELGKAAYRHASLARRELERLQAQAGSVDSLVPAERKALEEDARTTDRAFKQLEADRNTVDQHLQWFRNLEKLQADLTLADEERHAARQQWQKLSSERDTLHWLTELLPHRHLFREKQALADAAVEREERLVQQRRQLQESQTRLAAHEAEEKRASSQLLVSEQAFRNALPALQQAHTLNHEYQWLKKSGEEAERQLSEHERMLQEIDSKLRTANDAHSSVAATLERILARFGQPHDGIRLPASPEQYLVELNQRRDALQEQVNTFSALRQTVREIQSMATREARLESEKDDINDAIHTLKAGLNENAVALVSARRTLESTLALLKRQRLARDASVEALRNSLEPETPCPVCGSQDHPYRVDSALLTALDAADQEEEARARAEVERLNALQIQSETRLEALQKHVVEITTEQEALVRDRQPTEQQLAGLPNVDEMLAQPAEQRQPWCEQALKTRQADHARIVAEISTALEWQSAARELEKHQQTLDGLRQQHATRREQRDSAQSAARQCQSELAGVEEKLQGLLGSYPSAQAWEDALEQSRRKAADVDLTARTARERTAADCNRLGNELELIGQQQQEMQKRLKTLEREIAAWKAEHAELEDLRLQELLAISDQDGKALLQRVEQAQQELNSTETTYKERDRQYQEHRRQQPTSESASQLQILAKQLGEQLEATTQRLRELQSRLLADDQAREKLRSLQAHMDAQRKEYQRWARISDLIGSQDGRTFRRIAQAYNLDLLIRHANVQLHNLARRYRLKRGGSDLGLLVIDTEMGDEIRSVHSLSGGETFLVSLALALGLASMASGTLSIESLFIDEGFGSLDPESLQLAMDALDGLQAQGRKVGVISHVQDMHERVPVQIRISPQGNGASRLEVR